MEAIFHQPGLLDRDHILPGVGNDEAGRGRPDMAGMAAGEIAALVDMAARDQPQSTAASISTRRMRAGIGT